MAITCEESRRGFIFARAYGAKGDGIADDTSAIQQALDASVSGQVILAPGRYKITSPLVPPQMPTNGGAYRSVVIRGVASSRADDILDASNYGSTLWMPDHDGPMFNLTGTRGVGLIDLNLVGRYPVRPGSVALRAVTSNKDISLSRVTLAGWDEAIQIGTPGESSSVNNDDWSLDDCWFLRGTVGIVNYCTESYGIRCERCTFTTDIAHRVVSHADGSAMNSFKAHLCSFYGHTIIEVHSTHQTGAVSGRDCIVLDGCLFEPKPTIRTYGKVFVSDAAVPNNPFGLTLRNCTLNLGADHADIFDPTFRALRYYGRGPLMIESCRIGGPSRIPIEIVIDPGSAYGSAILRNNVWPSARPSYIRPKGMARQPIYEQANVVLAEASQKITDAPQVAYNYGSPDEVVSGSRSMARSQPNATETWLAGSTYQRSSAPFGVAVCVKSGTVGSVSGVVASIEQGSDMATITDGLVAERKKLYAGAYITVDGAGPYEIRDVVGDEIYLHETHESPARSGALTFWAPEFE